jgi:hypothetical protein
MIQAQVETITPSWALSVLAEQAALDEARGRRQNRPIKKATVTRYARQMEVGQWRLNGEPLIFNGRRCLDGQHRLSAVVVAGVPVQMLVVRGVDEAAFGSIDQGGARTAGHILSVSGVSGATIIGGAAALVMAYQNKGHMQLDPTSRPSAHEASAFVLEHELRFVSAFDAVNDAYRFVGAPAVLVAVSFLAHQHDEPRRVFFDGLRTGANLSMSSPVRHLRERLIAERDRKGFGRADMVLRAAWTVKAWNAFVVNEPMKLLKHNPEHEFPRLLV